MEAIDLGIQFYEGKAKAVVGKGGSISPSFMFDCLGLSGTLKKRKEEIIEQVHVCVGNGHVIIT